MSGAVSLVCLIVAQGVGVGKSEDSWWKRPLLKASSPAWQSIRATTQSEVSKTHSLPTPLRLKRIGEVNQACSGERFDAVCTYRAASFWLAFRNEWKAATGNRSNALLRALAESSGINDPEYVRVIYEASCLTKNPGPWPLGLGRRLVAMYPNDEYLPDARVYEATLAKCTIDDVKDALLIINSEEKEGMDRPGVARRRAGVYHAEYELTHSHQALELAIQNYDEVARTVRDPLIRSTARSWAEALRKQL